jgi:hypothetical protein
MNFRIGTCVTWSGALDKAAHFPTLKRYLRYKSDGTVDKDIFFVVMASRVRVMRVQDALIRQPQVQIDSAAGVWFSSSLFVECSKDIQALFSDGAA